MGSQSSADVGPLAGLRVLELTTGIAGQTTGMLLADLGADVVRPIGPDDAERWGRPAWLCVNRGKALVAHDMDPVEDVRQLRRLAARADLLVADSQPGWLEDRGLDQASVERAFPALAHVWMPPISTRGRWCRLPHDGLLLDAVSGFSAHHPASREVPVASAVGVPLLMHGALAASTAAAALVARERDGWGRAATVTGLMAEALILCTLVSRSIDGTPVISSGKSVLGAPNFRLYRSGDDRWMYLAALSPELFYKALDVLDRMEVLVRDDVGGEFANLLRPGVAESVGEDLQATFSTRTIDEWIAAFRRAGVPAAPMEEPGHWLQSEIVRAACPPLTRPHPSLGDVELPGVPLIMSANDLQAGDLPRDDVGAMAAVWSGVDPLLEPSGDRPDPAEGPLAGLRVLDTATFLAGPAISALLATHGADVVKVEAPTGDPYHVFTTSYGAVNALKRRVRLDLRDEVSRQAFVDLVARADVSVDNLLPASLARLGLAPEVFHAANPRLVRCSVTAYGQTGPWAEFPGFDPLMQTLSGLVAIQGGTGRPVVTSAPVHDVACAALGALGTLAALLHRARHGEGQRVFVSLAATSTFLQSAELTSYAGRPPRAVGGHDFAGPTWWQHLYEAADRFVAVSARTTGRQHALLTLIDHPELAGAPDDEVTTACAAWFAGRTAEDAVTALAAVGVPAASVLQRLELDDPFLRENAYTYRLDTPDGPFELLGGFTDWRGCERRRSTWPDGFDTTMSGVAESWSTPRAPRGD